MTLRIRVKAKNAAIQGARITAGQRTCCHDASFRGPLGWSVNAECCRFDVHSRTLRSNTVTIHDLSKKTVTFKLPDSADGKRAIIDEPRDHTADAVQIVRESLDFAIRDPELAPDGLADAAGICRVLLELAVDRHGRRGKDLLMDWGIVTSEDVGRILERLIEAGGATSFGEGPKSDFDGIFDLREPPESWQLRW